MTASVCRSVPYGDKEIRFRVIENTVLYEKIRIHVYPNQSVEVEIPLGELQTNVDAAVRKRARWIIKQINEAKSFHEHVLPREYISGETYFYLGRRHKLKINSNPVKETNVKLVKGELQVQVRVNDPAAIKRRLESWYINRAKLYIQNRLMKVCEDTSWVHNVPPMKLSSMQMQWGSLSPEGVVHINPWLIRASVECIDYVLCHELCHLVERNHSKDFYRLLEQRLPDWNHRKSKLDGMAELLLAS